MSATLGNRSAKPFDSMPFVRTLLLTFGFILLSVIFGLVAVSAHPIIIGVAVGLLVGVALIAKPAWNIWLIFVLGLLVAGLLPLYFDALTARAVWGISILGLLLLVVAISRAMANRHVSSGTPGFVWVAAGFMVFALINSLVQYNSAYETLSGFKRYFQVIGLLFAFSWLSISENEIRNWRWFFLFLALVQLPWAIYERIVLMPIREGLRSLYPFMVPFDVIAGTFGASLHEGGGNSEMATFLIAIFAFLLARWREQLLNMRKLLLVAPLVLAPIFLGETKVVVVLLPLMFLVLFRREIIAKPHIAVMAFLVGVGMTLAAGYAYMTINNLSAKDEIEQTLDYNFRDQGHGGWVLNRTKVLTFWAQEQGTKDPVSFVFGNGLGAAHDKTGGHISERYPGYGIGLTAASVLLWEQGVFGTALFALMLFLAWRSAGRLFRSARTPWIRAEAAAIEAVLPLLVVYVFYRLTQLEHLAFQIIFYALLGYLAWLIRHNAALARTET